MKQNNRLQSMVIAALLCTIGIIIPMYSPVRIMLEPASFTLASHVPIFIAMFISPWVAISVAFITTFGFLFAGFPIVIVLRAFSHIVFAGVGAFILLKRRNTLRTVKSTVLFGLFIAVIHATCEVIVVTLFYQASGMTSAYYEKGYLVAVIGLVGIGTIIHSMIDFGIAIYVWKPLQQVVNIPTSVKVMKNI